MDDPNINAADFYPAEIYVDFKGWRFRAPFRCMCCGRIIDIQQFCYGRYCGICDMGKCEHKNGRNAFGIMCYSGPREIIDANDPYFLVPERWLNPETGLEGGGENPYPPKKKTIPFDPPPHCHD